MAVGNLITQDYVSKLKETLTCSMCLEVYGQHHKQPKTLQCLHSFCMECLQKYIEKNLDQKLPCPLCQTTFEVPERGVQAVPTNVALKGMLDLLHQETGIDDQQEVVKQKCSEHSSFELTFVCKDCKVGLCARCMITIGKGPHATHELEQIQVVMKEVAERAEHFADKITVIEDKMNTLSLKQKEKLTSWRQTNEAVITEEAQKAIAQVCKWKEENMNIISATFAKAIKLINNQDKIDIDKMEAALANVKELCRKWKIHALQNIDTMEKDLVEVEQVIKQWENKDVLPHKIKCSESCTIQLGGLASDKAEPLTTYTAPILTKSLVQRVDGKIRVGISDHGDVIVGNLTDNTLVMYSCDGKHYQQQWQKSLPDGFAVECDKHILHDGNVVLKRVDEIAIYNKDLTKLLRKKKCGQLIAVLPCGFLAYKKDKDNHIDLLNMNDKLIITLHPPQPGIWRKQLSVCNYGLSGGIVVVSRFDNYLSIYTKNGTIVHHIALDYRPRDMGAVTCSQQYIFVAQFEPPKIHIYNWLGQLLDSVDHQKLGVDANKLISNITWTREGLLHMAENNSGVTVSHLRAYRVICDDMI